MTEKQWMVEFAKKLKLKMEVQGIDQKQLAKLSGLSEASISKYVSGLQIPKIFAFMRIAKALHSTLYELLPYER